jgi:hypothetical protein
LALLRRSGYVAEPVERFVAAINCKRDLWHFGDLLAVSDRREPRFLIVQCTSMGHVGDRLAKARACPELAVWLRAGGAFQVHGWTRRAGRWTAKVVEVQAEALSAVVVQAPTRRRRANRQRELFD